MKRNMMRRNLLQSIKHSFGRYIAIVAIIALGAGIFVGLRTAKSDMVATGQRYMDEQNMFDLRLLSTYGWDKDDVSDIALLDGVADAEGVISLDVIAAFSGADTNLVYKAYAIPDCINKVYLHGGRMPQNPYECLADGYNANDDILGKEIVISSTNDKDTLDAFAVKRFKVVGYVSTPLYMDMSRGTTSLGNGTISGYLYFTRDAFDLDYYTEIDITLSGEDAVYTDVYHDRVQKKSDDFMPRLEEIAEDRFAHIKAEATDAYAEGLQEYEDGLAEYNKGLQDAQSKLADAKKKLTDGEKEITDNRKLLEKNEKQIKDGQAVIDRNRIKLADSRKQLAETKLQTYAQLDEASADLEENAKTVSSAAQQASMGIEQISSGITQLNGMIEPIESAVQQLETNIQNVSLQAANVNAALVQAKSDLESARKNGATQEELKLLENAVTDAQKQLDECNALLTDLIGKRDASNLQLGALYGQRADLMDQKAELEKQMKGLEEAMAQIELGRKELLAQRALADKEFADADVELKSGEQQLNNAQYELNRSKKLLEEGRKELETAEQELKDGWAEYYSAESEAKNELEEGRIELDNAKLELEEAEEAINSMDSPDVYALGRTTNVGYLALDNNSSIVEGVSTVLPGFFLLIAALVCITTMTRMVEDERTQIGILKALGYGNSSIIGKYLAYAGSAALIGCGFGVAAGSVVFPSVLWEAYQIIIFLGDYLVLQMDWMLCIVVVGVYTAVTLFVTWYCCRMSLKEVPAELIRPKPPTTGRKILVEKLPFWNKFSFLNKVMFRNIFRYRQRMLMMLVGIAGCTALLLCGFGIRDSIGDLPAIQFSEVILYDLEVRFDHALTEKEQMAFASKLDVNSSSVFMYHQSSAELEFDSQVKEVSFIAAENDLEKYIDFHNGKNKLTMPGAGEALVSAGVAEMLGIAKNDHILVRDSNLKTLNLRVSGIFDNNVQNYVVVSPRTVLDQWGEKPDVQMGCVLAADDAYTHEIGAMLAATNGVMSVTVNADMEENITKTLEALDLVVVTVVICAGLLAVIVLYNLTNINITERIREIATIKVLGFNAFESAAYVFKENLVLSAVGSLIGLGLGVFLLEFVMSQIKVDIVWMTARLNPVSYVWAFIITMLSACLVDFVFYFKLDKINMAEALKSVE